MKAKRFLSALIILSTLFTVCQTFAADNEAQIASGKLGDNIIWAIKDNVLTVSGRGATYDFESSRCDFAITSDIAMYVNTLIIEEGITSIGKRTFAYCNDVTEIIFPKSLEEIGERAFWGTCIKKLSFPEESSLRTIGIEAFQDCHWMEEADLSNCKNLEKLEPYAFSECDNLSSILFPSEGMFSEISKGAFFYCNGLTSVVLPSTLKSIGKYAFYACKNLKSIVLPEGFASLGDEALYSCSSLAELVIPSSMYEIGGWTLHELDSAEKYTVSPNNSAFSSDENGVLYNRDKTALIKFPAASKLKNYTIPASVEVIHPYAFDGCSTLEEVEFEENSALASVDQRSFSGSSIKRITLPEGVKFIGEAAFDNCYYLEKIVLPDGITEIKDSAFKGSGIKSVDIPQSVTIIANEAFYGCDNLDEINLPEGLTAIGHTAFGACDALRKVSLPASLFWLNPKAFSNSNTLEKITVSEQNPYYSTDDYGALYCSKTELIWYPKLSNNKSYTIPNSVTAIKDGVFENTKNLEKIIIPSTFSELDSSVFQNCKSLKTIVIPKEITKIGSSAFYGCTNLTEVIFEDNSNLTSIGDYAFYGCNSLKEFNVPDSVTSIYSNAFGGCAYLEKVNFSQNSKLDEISDYPFTGSNFVTIYAPYGSFAYEYAEKHRIQLPLTVNINGSPIKSDVPPMMVLSRTMIPMRAAFEALEAEVVWNEETKTAIATKGENTVEIKPDSHTLIVNGKEHSLDSPAFIYDERLMIPLRDVSEAFGAQVNWNQETKTADITY